MGTQVVTGAEVVPSWERATTSTQVRPGRGLTVAVSSVVSWTGWGEAGSLTRYRKVTPCVSPSHIQVRRTTPSLSTAVRSVTAGPLGTPGGGLSLEVAEGRAVEVA